jgi:hypothetical protein
MDRWKPNLFVLLPSPLGSVLCHGGHLMRILCLCLFALVASGAKVSAQVSPDQDVRGAVLALQHLEALGHLPASWRPAVYEVRAGDGPRRGRNLRGLEEAIPVADERLRVRGTVPLIRCTEEHCEAIERDFVPVMISLLEPPYTGLDAAEGDLVFMVGVPEQFTPGSRVRSIGLETLVVGVSDVGSEKPAVSVIQRRAATIRARPRR